MASRAFAIAALLALTATAAAAQDKPVVLRLSHWLSPSHPLQKAMEEWAASVTAASGGTITVAVYPAQQLGKTVDHYDIARDGVADLTLASPGATQGRFPVIGAGEIPFLIADGKGGSAALDAWYRKYAAAEMKDVKFCLAFVHDPGTLHAKTKKIFVPGDLKGMKIRSGQATVAAFVTALGGINVASTAPEMRDIVDKGLADAVTFPWGSIPLFGLDKVTKYHMEVPLYTTTFAWVMNKPKYDGLSASQKQVIDDHCTTEWALKVASPWADFEHGGIAKLKAAAGHEVYPLSAEQLAEWRKAAQPLEASWNAAAQKAGIDPDAAMKELRDSLTQYKAAF